MAPSKSSYAARLPIGSLSAPFFLGAFARLFFGDDAAFLPPIGTIYVKLMEVVVFPNIIFSFLSYK